MRKSLESVTASRFVDSSVVLFACAQKIRFRLIEMLEMQTFAVSFWSVGLNESRKVSFEANVE